MLAHGGRPKRAEVNAAVCESAGRAFSRDRDPSVLY
jgi:hypothetical protein